MYNICYNISLYKLLKCWDLLCLSHNERHISLHVIHSSLCLLSTPQFQPTLASYSLFFLKLSNIDYKWWARVWLWWWISTTITNPLITSMQFEFPLVWNGRQLHCLYNESSINIASSLHIFLAENWLSLKLRAYIIYKLKLV